MSLATVRNKVYQTLVADPEYIELLGSPVSQPFKTYYIEPPAQPSFPFTVYTLRPHGNNQAFGRDFLVSRATLTCNVWDSPDGGAPEHEEIMLRIIQVLHQAVLSEGFRCILALEPQELRDHELNAYGLTTAFDVIYRRSLQ